MFGLSPLCSTMINPLLLLARSLLMASTLVPHSKRDSVEYSVLDADSPMLKIKTCLNVNIPDQVNFQR